MSEKRRDNKGRILKTGESQRKDGRYLYKYIDSFVYRFIWRTAICLLVETCGYRPSTSRKA